MYSAFLLNRIVFEHSISLEMCSSSIHFADRHNEWARVDRFGGAFDPSHGLIGVFYPFLLLASLNLFLLGIFFGKRK